MKENGRMVKLQGKGQNILIMEGSLKQYGKMVLIV